ncbi:c-type cytochrome [Rhodobacteraceae bacterium]|nr:c-type cytochrome [Paracoccaceae bacterium]
MKLTLATSLIVGFLAAPAFADGHASGDAEAGEKAFNKCKSCHTLADGDGNVIVRGGKTGPNLWGLPGRTAGTEADFKRYKASVVEAGEAGLVWNEDDFVTYVQDPTGFLKTKLDDSKARSGMTFRLRDEEEAANVWAYIASVSPAPES